MTQLSIYPAPETGVTGTPWASLCKISGVIAFIQLGCLLFSLVIIMTVGGEPTTASEYFQVLQADRLTGLLRLDFTTLLMLALFGISTFGVYAALRRTNPAYAALATALSYVGITLAFATNSALSMVHLSDQYAATSTAAQKELLLAAGEALIASGTWHSTGGFMAGLFMQGGFVIFSIIMLQYRAFSKVTAYSGLFSNGLDFAHVLIGLFAPAIANGLLYIAGPIYLVWFVVLGRDLLRLGQASRSTGTERVESVSPAQHEQPAI
jgi:hypothetical protein